MHVRTAWLLCCLALASGGAYADRLVFGSFGHEGNAQGWAQQVSDRLDVPVSVVRVERAGGRVLHRVQSEALTPAAFDALKTRADTWGLTHWRLKERAPAEPVAQTAATDPQHADASVSPAHVRDAPVQTPPPREASASVAPSSKEATTPAPGRTVSTQFEWEAGLQSRVFAREGFASQSRHDASLSLEAEYHRAWNNGQHSVTITPFLRADSEDPERSHFDLRELFYSQVGDDWDLHIGARRVFWGVTEFHHLIDIINQTDLVENIDTEDKLGQPMVEVSLVRDWGVLDVYLLTGFRERTLPGREGRLRLPYRIDRDATYASGAQEQRVDGAVRWSHHAGPVELGLHYFSGTSRDPLFETYLSGAGDVVLRPHYTVIDQVGLDAQAFYGDWVVKFEGMRRSGYGAPYRAFNVGFERTLVGFLGSRMDVGIVAEYMYDERGADAVNTLFERDVALGWRMQVNDFANSTALLGVIYDTQRHDYVVSLEASRELGAQWSVQLEGRVFNGGEALRRDTINSILTDASMKSSWLQRDDYLQVELTRYF